MADSNIAVTEGSGKNVDTRTNAAGDHRQVIVVGNPTATDSVAEVQATDPSSNTLGLVVRDVNTSAIVGALTSGVPISGTITGITNSVAVHILSTNGTMAVNVGKTDGTVTIRTDPGYELGSIKGINSSINTYIGGTAGTLGVRVGQIDGTVAVYFSPSNPAVAATFSAASLEVVPTTGSRKMTDDSHAAMRVLIAGTQAAASLQVSGITSSIATHILSTNGTMAVNVGKVDGTVTVRFDPGYELGSIKGINSSAAVHVLSTGGTIITKLDRESVLSGIQSTVNVRVGQLDGTVAVYFSPSNPAVSATFSAASIEVIPTTGSRTLYEEGHKAVRALIVGTSAAASLQVTGITNTIAVHLLSTNGTMAVNLGKTDGTITVRTDPSYELGSIRGINSSISVHLLSTGGTLNVRMADNSAGLATDDLAITPGTDVGFPAMAMFDDTATDSVDEGDAGFLRMTGNRILMVHSDSTASIFTVSGSTSGVSPSGVTLVSPSANASFKIFAFSLQTTGIVSCVARFTNGAGSATEFWRGLVTANQTSSIPIGANLAVSPPSYIFATGVSTTLSLHLDTATLVHYSVSYFKESA